MDEKNVTAQPLRLERFVDRSRGIDDGMGNCSACGESFVLTWTNQLGRGGKSR